MTSDLSASGGFGLNWVHTLLCIDLLRQDTKWEAAADVSKMRPTGLAALGKTVRDPITRAC